MEKFITRPVSNLLYDQENLQSYCAGGFHPVRLGDQFKEGRYEVVHKLGWGGFSTVWLARDIGDEKWVAVKICKASSATSWRELSTLQSVRENRASKYVVDLYDDFIHEGPNGLHLCIVTEFLGPSLSAIVADYHCSGDRLEPEEIFRLTRQLLQATISLHEAGFAHGDISGANIVFTTSNMAALSKQAIFDIVGEPETADLLAADATLLGPGLPKQLVRKIQWDSWTDEDEEDIRLIDLGESFRIESAPNALAQPSELRAPETIFAGTFDYKVDLWRIYSLVFASYPFQFLGDDNVLIAQMIGFVENLPFEWEEKWRQMRKTLRHHFSATQVSAESKLVQRFADLVPETELAPLIPIIQGLMRFRPAERISARDALELLQY